MPGIKGSGGESAPLSPENKKLYEQEYKHGVDLFQRAMVEYGQAKEIHKKEAFKEVMDRALQVLGETARALHRSDLLNQNKKISHDYQVYQDKTDEASKNQLAQDLNQAKKSIS